MEFRDCDEGAAAKVGGQLAGVTLPIFPISRDFSTWCCSSSKFKVSERNYIRAEANTLAGQNLARIAFPCLKFLVPRNFEKIGGGEEGGPLQNSKKMGSQLRREIVQLFARRASFISQNNNLKILWKDKGWISIRLCLFFLYSIRYEKFLPSILEKFLNDCLSYVLKTARVSIPCFPVSTINDPREKSLRATLFIVASIW